MTQFLPPNLLGLFKAREPIPFLPPVDQLPFEKKTSGYTGLAEFVKSFEDPAETPDPVKIRTREERRADKRQYKAEATAYKLEQDIALWNPQVNPNGTTDPYKTLFVARINYDTSEAKLRREFEMYGRIKKIVLVHDLKRKPRGYAFIEYERERDMHSAYKHADGRKIEGKRVLVDYEKGRTLKGWLPRRLGGGLGGTRIGGPDVNMKHSGRDVNGPGDRHMDRDRDRAERPERRRSRSKSRERRRKSRSRSRDRHRGDRGDRRKRERSRDRERGRDLAVGAGPGDASMDGAVDVAVDGEPPRKERRRSRSRDRDRKRRRSRSRERKRHDRDRDQDRDRRQERESRRERGGEQEERVERIKEERLDGIKDEPMGDEPVQDTYNNGDYGEEYNYDNGEPNAYEGY